MQKEEMEQLQTEISRLENEKRVCQKRMESVREEAQIYRAKIKILKWNAKKEPATFSEKVNEEYYFQNICGEKEEGPKELTTFSMALGILAAVTVLLSLGPWFSIMGEEVGILNFFTDFADGITGAVSALGGDYFEEELRLLSLIIWLCRVFTLICPALYIYGIYRLWQNKTTSDIQRANIAMVILDISLILIAFLINNSLQDNIYGGYTYFSTAFAPKITLVLGIIGIVVEKKQEDLGENSENREAQYTMPCMTYSLTDDVRIVSGNFVDYGQGIRGIVLHWVNYGKEQVDELMADLEILNAYGRGIRILGCRFERDPYGSGNKSREIFVKLPNLELQNMIRLSVYPRQTKKYSVKRAYSGDIVEIRKNVEDLRNMRVMKPDAVCEYAEDPENWICTCGAVNDIHQTKCMICGEAKDRLKRRQAGNWG